MEAMIRDLLKLASLDSDPGRFVPVDTSTTLEHALSNLHAVIQENDAHLRVAGRETLGPWLPVHSFKLVVLPAL